MAHHYYSVFLASGQNHFTQEGKQSACNQRSPLIAFNRDSQEDRLEKYLFGGRRITKLAYENGIFGGGHITTPAYKKNKAQGSGSSSSFWSRRRRDPPRMPPAALHAHVTASPRSTCSRVPSPMDLLRGRGNREGDRDNCTYPTVAAFHWI